MKNKFDIIKRCLVVILISDRVRLENPAQWNDNPSLSEREEHRNYLANICDTRNCIEYLTIEEKEVLNTEVGKIKKSVIDKYLYQYEAVQILSWALGYYKYPSFDNGFFYEDLHSFVCEENILNPPEMIDIKELEIFRKVAMLWHWRSIEGRKNKAIYKTDIKEQLLTIFREDFTDAYEHIHFSESKTNDFVVNNLIYNEISKQLHLIMEIKTERIHHTIEWILTDCKWDEVELST